MFIVSETFVSLAGESRWQGRVCTFIRFTGCQVECEWCDTLFAREEEGREMSLGDLLTICAGNGAKRVVLTGGEPLLQKELPQLCVALLEAGHMVQVETSGTILADMLDQRVMKVVDIKPPGAKAKRGFHWGNLDLLGERDEIKFVIASREDYDWARRIMRKTGLENSQSVIFSAVAGRLEPRTLARWVLEDRLDARFQVQLHKVLWPGEDRGR